MPGTSGRRGFLAGGLAALAAAGIRAPRARAEETADPGSLRARRLDWAGVELVAGDATLMIDATPPQDPATGIALAPQTPRRYALVTHLHGDHFAPDALKAALGERGSLVCHAEVAADAASRGLRVRSAPLYQPLPLGDFTVAAVPASDGVGDDQVSWIVAGGGRRVIHCGDTQWHGGFWTLGRMYGPFDLAFLPINGADFRFQRPRSGVPATLTPEQAVAAAVLLGARLVVPIHYGAEPDPESYVEVEDPVGRCVDEARRRGVAVEVVAPGAAVTWAPAA